MKVRIIFILLCINSTVVFGQIKYEAGYYIDNSDVRLDGLILNKDWKNSPVVFSFKTTETGASQTMGLENVKEFGIGGHTKYVKARVSIDTTNVKTYKRGPQWMITDVFLRVVIESTDITLFEWSEKENNKFFFKIKDRNTEQLIFKKYRVKGNGNQLYYEATNNDYLFQLEEYVSCVGLGKPNPKCTYKDLKKHFTEVIECRQLNVVFDEKNQKKVKFSLAPQIGYEFSTFQTSGRLIAQNYDFEYPKGRYIRFGLEGEILLPFSKNRWSIVVAPSFKNYEETSKEILSRTGYIKYSALEFPAGLSYNFVFNNSRVFFRGYLVQDFVFGSKFTNDVGGPTVDIDLLPRTTASLGGGVTVKKLSLECRYYVPRKFLRAPGGWVNQYQSMAFFLSYRLVR